MFKKSLFLVFTIILGFNSFAQLAANFSVVPATGCSTPHVVFFTDQSTLPDTWLWNFGDGNTSTLQNPVHVYTSTGNFTVTLTVTDTVIGGTDTETAQVSVNIPNASISGTGTNFFPGPPDSFFGCGPLTCKFLDNSSNNGPDAITGWSWNFGDGNTSTQQSPTHTYQTSGIYTVSLTVTNTSGCTNTQTLTNMVQVIGPNVNFGADTLSNECPPLAVNFTDSTIFGAPIINWTWNFGDGSPTSNLQNPSHTYNLGGMFDVSLAVTDIDGCSRTLTFDDYIQIVDVTPPSITCPANITINNDALACGGTATYTAPVGTDNCSGPTTNLTAGFTSGSLFPIGTTTNTYQVTDGGGLMATCSFDVTVIDIEAPTISCPGNQTETANASCQFTLPDYTALATASDNCTPSITQSPVAGTVISGTSTITLTADDGSGNTSNCTFDVLLQESIAPTAVCQDINLYLDGTGNATISPSDIDGGSTDNCGGVSLSASQLVFSCNDLGPNNITLTVTDGSANDDNCIAVVTVIDTISPTITCQTNMTQNNDVGQCDAVVTYTAPVGTDNCAGSTTIQTAGLASGSNFPVGTTTNTFVVTDAAGNTATCSFDIIISDTELPTISCMANIAQNSDLGQCDAVVNYTAPVGLDNCPGSTTAQTAGLASGSTFPLGTTTNTFVVTDAAGNTASCSFDVVISDSELPTISCISDIAQSNDAGQCTAVVNYTAPVGLDTCPGASTTQTGGLASGSAFPIGTTTNTFLVTDAAGNTATCSFDVVISDTELPTISCLADIIQNNDVGICGATITYATPAGADNCPGATTSQTAGLASGSVFPIGTTTNTFVVTDAAGLTATCSFDVVITDTENPTISCPSTISQNNDVGSCGAIVTYTSPVGADNCPGATTVQTAGLTNGSLFPIGTTTNTFMVTDAVGLTATCSFDIIITDTENPTITCPGNINQNNDAGSCGAVVNYTPPVGNDNCAGATTVQTAGLASGSTFPMGITTNTFLVTDATGLTSTCSFDVTVTDAESPSITYIGDINQVNDPGGCGAIITFTNPIGTDNCPGATTSQIAGLPSGSLFPTGTTTNTFEVIDAAGLTATCSFDVMITDSEAPEITCPTNINLDNNLGVCGKTAMFTAPIGTDNCAGVTTTLTSGLTSGSVFPIGTTTNSYMVTDAGGLTATCSFDIVIVDIEPPAITCLENFATCDSIISFDEPEFIDNCPGPTLSLISGIESGNLFPNGPTTNTYEVTDASGNANTCELTITRYIQPYITLPETINLDAGKTVLIDALTSDAVLFDWMPNEFLNNPNIEDPIASPQETTTYSLYVESPDGCSYEDEVTITVGIEIEVNNLFSPNGDGRNDTWEIKGNYLMDDCTIQIYDSWGNKIYESIGYDNNWDGSASGKELTEGNYYYVISCPSKETLTGSITVVK